MTVSSEALKKYRKLKNKKQEDVAEALRVGLGLTKYGQSTYATKEQKGDFNEREIAIIARYLEIEPGQIMLAYPADREVKTKEYTVTNLVKVESILRVLLKTNAEILAHQRKVPVEKVIHQLTKDVEAEIQDTLDQLP